MISVALVSFFDGDVPWRVEIGAAARHDLRGLHLTVNSTLSSVDVGIVAPKGGYEGGYSLVAPEPAEALLGLEQGGGVP